MRVVVTTPFGADAGEQAAAAACAERFGLDVVARERRSLATIARRSIAEAVLIVGRLRAALWVDGREHVWHGGMGALRLRRLQRGENVTRDAFLEAAALRPGEAVLDATLGMGMDALVAAGTVGEGGRVVGIESSLPLAALVAEGLARESAAARRIEVVHGDAAEVLTRLPPRSFDVVVFDPMFREPRAGAPGFDLVRRLANSRPLAPDTLARAREIARRCVIVKDGSPGWDLSRLGLKPLPSARGAKRLYARVETVDPLRSP